MDENSESQTTTEDASAISETVDQSQTGSTDTTTETATQSTIDQISDAQEVTEDAPVEEDAEVEKEYEEEVTIDQAMVEKLSLGVMELFLPNLQKAKGQLNEVLHNQEVRIETIEGENLKFTDSEARKKLSETMVKARLYHTKLVNLKKEMNALNDKSSKLKKRAVKLQQQKKKEEHYRTQQQEKELEKERMLTAKVAVAPKAKPEDNQ